MLSPGPGGTGAPAPAAFRGNELEEVRERSRIEHVPGTDPSAPGQPHTESHLASQRLDTMTIAVHDERGPRLGCRSRAVAVEIHVHGRAVDFERGTGFRGRRVQRVEVERVPLGVADEAIRGMAEDVDQGMADGL